MQGHLGPKKIASGDHTQGVVRIGSFEPWSVLSSHFATLVPQSWIRVWGHSGVLVVEQMWIVLVTLIAGVVTNPQPMATVPAVDQTGASSGGAFGPSGKEVDTGMGAVMPHPKMVGHRMMAGLAHLGATDECTAKLDGQATSWMGLGAAYSGMVVLGLALGGLVAYVLQALCAPVRWVLEGTLAILRIVGCCCRRSESAEVPVLAAPNLARSIEWHGPATGWNTETRYLQERIKGRGSRRKLNDIVVRYEGQVARLQQDESRLKRIDAFGLRVQFASIAGCSSRAFRKKLEDTGEVHLCRKDERGLDHGLHIREFAGLDHEAILDVHDYTRGGTCWLLRSSWRGFCWGLATAWFLLTYLCRCCCRKQGIRKQTKADGSTRILHPDSESEIEAEDNTCEGVHLRQNFAE